MCTDFLVFDNQQFAHRASKTDNYVCYRTVICHALLWKMNHPTGASREEVIESFNSFANAVRNTVEHEDRSFLSIFIAHMRGEIGYIVVDKSRGYYPLVAYPFVNKKGATRAAALREAIDDLSNNLIPILNELDQHRDWSMALQQDLQNNFFHYAEEDEEEEE